MVQRIAILHGHDWVDASVKFVNIPDDQNIHNLEKEYREYRTKLGIEQTKWFERNPNYRQTTSRNANDPYPKLLSLDEWLIKHSVGLESDVIEYWES